MGKNRRISPTLLHRYALRSPLICEAWRGRVWQTPKWGKAPLQKFCKRQNREMRPCRSPANTKMRKSALAEVLQTPKWGKAPLQESCKRQNEEKRPCRSTANAKMGKSAFAETLQSPETSSKCLRESRKSPGKLFGVCGNPASPTKNFLAFAGVPQALTLIQYEEWECSLSTVCEKNRRWYLCRRFRTASNPC